MISVAISESFIVSQYWQLRSVRASQDADFVSAVLLTAHLKRHTREGGSDYAGTDPFILLRPLVIKRKTECGGITAGKRQSSAPLGLTTKVAEHVDSEPYLTLGSEVAHRVASTLATVRLPNRACRFPAHGFHEDAGF